MKKIFAIVCVLVLSMPLFAQQVVIAKNGVDVPANEVGVSYGRVSMSSFVYFMGGVLGTAFSFGLAKVSTMASVGSVGLEYHRYVHPNVAVGATLTYEDYLLGFDSRNGKDADGTPIYKKGPVQNHHIFSVMPSVKFPWFHLNHMSMYSKLALGASYVYAPSEVVVSKDDDGTTKEDVVEGSHNWQVAFQATPVGIDFGGRAVRGFAEFGFGYQGLALVGLRYRF